MRKQNQKLSTRLRITLKMKMVSGLTAMLILFLIAAMYNAQQLEQMKSYLGQQNEKVELKLMALELKEMVQELNIIASGLEISKKAEYIPKYNEKRKVFESMIKRIGDTASTPEQVKWRSQLISLTVEYTNTFDVAAKLVQDNKLASADLDKNMEYLYNESQRLMNDIFINVDQFYVDYSKGAEQAIAATQSLMHRTSTVLWIASAFVVVVGAAIAAVLVSSFSRPMRQLQQAVQRMASGDLRSKIGSRSQDELGLLSQSFDHMVDQVRSMLLQTQSIAASLSDHSTSFHRLSGSTATANAEIIRAIQEISAGADKQANHSEHSASLIADLEQELATIAQYSETVQQKSREAAFNTHTGSASMEQLKQASQSSEGVLDKVYTAMEGLSASTVQIHRIVNTITEISHQTNVLALNAAIEAARAGVHGRGFSVIAEEVRQLSTQTNESSKSIAVIIKSLLEQTGELEGYLSDARQTFGVQNKKMNDSMEAFQEIRSSMEMLSQHIDQIQAQIELAKNKNGMLVESVQFVAAIAQETAAGVEEVNSTSVEQDNAIQRIAQQADDILVLSQKLFHEIQQFRMSEDASLDADRNGLQSVNKNGDDEDRGGSGSDSGDSHDNNGSNERQPEHSKPLPEPDDDTGSDASDKSEAGSDKDAAKPAEEEKKLVLV
ncbi:methyl-accepting chemotaxis protein [Paenibacillus sp. NPDC056579]|uniref:methyl-accepting chemotaxis protein n=1 Tax=Paenibacillus sp. NPDC056579 TaxID=3345871 RepID=UPI00368E6C1C